MNSNAERGATGMRRPAVVGTVCVVGAVVVVGVVVALAGGMESIPKEVVLHTVTRGPLDVVDTARGNLESQTQVNVNCEVDDIEGDNIRGTPILWIIENGSQVEEGELIVELDVSSHRERLDRQILDVQQATAAQVQADVKYQNQKTQNETNRAEAKLQVELAELALKQFEDEHGGTFQIDLQDIELLIQEAQAQKLIEATNLQGVEQLYDLGYRSRGELDQARLSALKAERSLASAVAKKKEKVEYQYRKTKLELGGALQSAKRALEQVERNNDAELAQAEAALRAANDTLKKEEERLARYSKQVEKAKIYSPATGMVAYATPRHRYESEIREGAHVHPRRTILSIPNLTRMQVQTSIHEARLDQVRPGLPTTVRVEAFPERAYRGVVRSVAVLPDASEWMSSDTKHYKTLVTIEEDVDQLKPGMNAVVEIHIAHLKDVISIPVTAILQRAGRNFCLVGAAAKELRPLELGLTNETQVEVKSGLEEGEVVVLNPDEFVDESQFPEPEKEEAPEIVEPEIEPAIEEGGRSDGGRPEPASYSSSDDGQRGERGAGARGGGSGREGRSWSGGGGGGERGGRGGRGGGGGERGSRRGPRS